VFAPKKLFKAKKPFAGAENGRRLTSSPGALSPLELAQNLIAWLLSAEAAF